MSDYQELSVNDLQMVIESAEKALKNKLVNHRKEVISQIKELAASIDVSVEITEGVKPVSKRSGRKVEIKYRHPSDSSLTWTGRGVRPNWLKQMISEGRDISEFSIF